MDDRRDALRVPELAVSAIVMSRWREWQATACKAAIGAEFEIVRSNRARW
jgi:hypothetical protein